MGSRDGAGLCRCAQRAPVIRPGLQVGSSRAPIRGGGLALGVGSRQACSGFGVDSRHARAETTSWRGTVLAGRQDAEEAPRNHLSYMLGAYPESTVTVHKLFPNKKDDNES